MKCVLQGQKINKEQIGLGNVDNTSDLNKPISTAVESALLTKVPISFYFDDMDLLTKDGHYRVSANINLPLILQYGQVIVVSGIQTDTVTQLGFGRTGNRNQIARGMFRHGTISSSDINVVDWENWQTIATTDMISNPNLLDNWDFTNPINQRGITETTGWGGYTIDRWSLDLNAEKSGFMTLQEDGILFNSTAIYSTFFSQSIDPIIAKSLAGKTITVSIWYGEEIDAHMSCSLYVNGEWTSANGNIRKNSIQSYTLALPSNTTNLRISIGANAAGLCKVKAVKLELGSISTLANDPPMNRDLELVKCQRYQIIYNSSDLCPYRALGSGYMYQDGKSRISVHLPTTMRTRPTSSFKGNFAMLNEYEWIPVTDISIDYPQSSDTTIILMATPERPIEVGKSVILASNLDTTAQFIFNSNL